MYSWPANVAKSDGKWIASLIDWPQVVGTDDSPQTAVLSASEALSQVVRERIHRKSDIPIPSELKPGQIQIPIDAETFADLSAYVIEVDARRLKQQSEVEKANREKRASYLSEFRANQGPIETLRGQATQASVGFAAIGIRSCFIMNGGALVAIPAILQFTESKTLGSGYLLASVMFFMIGVLISALTNYLAYLSVNIADEGHGFEADARAIVTTDSYYPPENPGERQAEVTDLRDKSQKKFGLANRIADGGVVAFFVSVLLFFIGVSVIIYGLEMRPELVDSQSPAAVESLDRQSNQPLSE